MQLQKQQQLLLLRQPELNHFPICRSLDLCWIRGREKKIELVERGRYPPRSSHHSSSGRFLRLRRKSIVLASLFLFLLAATLCISLTRKLVPRTQSLLRQKSSSSKNIGTDSNSNGGSNGIVHRNINQKIERNASSSSGQGNMEEAEACEAARSFVLHWLLQQSEGSPREAPLDFAPISFHLSGFPLCLRARQVLNCTMHLFTASIVHQSDANRPVAHSL